MKMGAATHTATATFRTIMITSGYGGPECASDGVGRVVPTWPPAPAPTYPIRTGR